jgi:signal transduction histidine kinase
MLFASCLAAPAVVLAILGLRTISLANREESERIARQQRQIAKILDLRLEERLQPGRLTGVGITGFTLHRNGTLLFPGDRVYFAEPGREPKVETTEIPGALAPRVEEALGAEARGESYRASELLSEISKDQNLRTWAALAKARMTSKEQPDHLLAVANWIVSSDDASRSPDGVPVVLLAATSLDLLPRRLSAMSGPVVQRAIEQLRASRWWMSLPTRRIYDEELRERLRRAGMADSGADSRIAELTAIERIVRRSAPFPKDKTVRQPEAEGGISYLVVMSPDQTGNAWNGSVLSGSSVSDLLTVELGSAFRDSGYPLAVANSSGRLVWGSAAALESDRPIDFASIPGWELWAGKAQASRRPLYLWSAFVTVLLLMLVFGLLMTLRITRREMELARLQADFTAAVTHEFKSPITCIRLVMERIRSGRIPDEASRQEYHDSVWRQIDRLERLVNRLLESHRIESGENRYHFALHCVSDIAATAVSRLSTQAAAKNIDLRLECDDFEREVLIDGTAIEDSIENLVENAIKYSEAGTSVHVTVEHYALELVVIVRDKGMGIPACDQERIFQRFYRVSSAPARSVRGAGLGLPLVRAVARAHGGSVDLRSAPGQGSEFRLRIPARQEEPIAANLDRG